MQQKDIKLLWGRAGNRCSRCRIELAQDGKAAGAAFTLGEQAHIVGEKPGAARWNADLSDADRDGYHNRILLCPTHHTEIDKNEADWPVERLYILKSQHELWVRETLSDSADPKSLAKQIAVTSIIDAAVELCDLENWQIWTSWALSPESKWPSDLPDKIFEFRQRVLAAIWPAEFDELRRATETLAILLSEASRTFLRHSKDHGEQIWQVRFYQGNGFNPNYDRDLKRFEEWQDECHRLIREATKAANWFGDVVRDEINPMFFAERGKFLISEGPFYDLSYRVSKPEFTAEERNDFPSALIKASA